MRRAMTCVYCEPKSRMMICSVTSKKGRVFDDLENSAVEKSSAAENAPAAAANRRLRCWVGRALFGHHFDLAVGRDVNKFLARRRFGEFGQIIRPNQLVEVLREPSF